MNTSNPIPPLFKSAQAKQAAASGTPAGTKPAAASPAAKATTAAAAGTTKAPAPKSGGRIPPAFKSAKNATTAAAGAPATTALSAEGVAQRLHYFETLATQHENYIAQLKALLTRSGVAVPVAYFAPLTGAGGTFTPKSG